MSKKDRWLKLDNAAKVFPYISSKSFANVFRLSATLKEDINKDVLQQAINDIKSRFPMFFVKMRVGAFWYYYEQNERKFILKEETPFIGSFKNRNKNNGYLIEMFYYQNRFSIEVFHAVSDAYGTLQLLKSILFRYFQLLGKDIINNGKVIEYNSSVGSLELEDSFNKHYRHLPNEYHRFKPVKAYKIKGDEFFVPGNGVIIGKVKSNDLYNLAKQYDCSVTQYLSGLLMESIYKYMLNYQSKNEKPITIVLPVNMRKYLDSETLRNFSLYIYLVQQVKDKEDITLTDFLDSIKNCYQEQLNIDNLKSTLYANMEIEKNTFLKFCPLFLKLIAVKLGYSSIAGGLQTISFSNLGVLKGIDCFKEYVEDIEFVACGTESSHSVCACTYNDITSISFSRSILSTEIEMEFFRSLASKTTIEITSNLWEEN